MKTKTLLASLALPGLVISQPVSAATQSIGSDPAARIASPAGESEALRGKPLLVIILVFLAIGGLIIALTDDSEPESP